MKQILEDQTMMNRETLILNELGSHPNIVSLISHFYSESPARQIGEPSPVNPNIIPTVGKKYLNLVFDFMPLNLSKYNQTSRQTMGTLNPVRIL